MRRMQEMITKRASWREDAALQVAGKPGCRCLLALEWFFWECRGILNGVWKDCGMRDTELYERPAIPGLARSAYQEPTSFGRALITFGTSLIRHKNVLYVSSISYRGLAPCGSMWPSWCKRSSTYAKLFSRARTPIQRRATTSEIHSTISSLKICFAKWRAANADAPSPQRGL